MSFIESREIKVPFQVGPSGAIDFTVDPVKQAIQHIISAAMTNPGERVMRPNYGVPLLGALFESDDPAEQAAMVEQIRIAVHAYVPEVHLESVQVDSDVTGGRVEFRISFQLVGSDDIHEANIFVGGTVLERTFPQ